MLKMNKMLIAMDGSGCSMKAVKYAGEHFSGISDLQITLLHILPMPAIFWDEGHILGEKEKEDRKRFFDQWKNEQLLKFEPFLDEAVEVLVRTGIKREQISINDATDTIDIADRIIEETRNGGYQTLLIGHCRHDEATHFIRGSVTREIMHRGSGATLSIVE
jgi:nucleotide-binding universal stress UspA family protein